MYLLLAKNDHISLVGILENSLILVDPFLSVTSLEDCSNFIPQFGLDILWLNSDIALAQRAIRHNVDRPIEGVGPDFLYRWLKEFLVRWGFE